MSAAAVPLVQDRAYSLMQLIDFHTIIITGKVWHGQWLKQRRFRQGSAQEKTHIEQIGGSTTVQKPALLPVTSNLRWVERKF